MLIDTHCHLHDREFFSSEQAEKMVENAHQNGVERIICIGTSHQDSLAAQDFATRHDNVYWTYGIHPEATNRSEFDPAFSSAGLEFLCTSYAGTRARNSTNMRERSEKRYLSPPIAIGEVGLDYHYEGYNREAQIRLFEEMLQLATDLDLPVSFHVREAFNDFLPVVKNFPKIRGVVHSFTDSKKMLKRILLETDFYIGVNGLATYSTLPTPPLERILLETDAPFLTPKPFRGIINEPAYVRNIAEWLSEKLGQEFKIIERETTKNANQLFKFESPVLR